MNTTILCPLTVGQLEALIEWHHHEAQHAGVLQAKSDHLQQASDLRRSLTDAIERTEAEA